MDRRAASLLIVIAGLLLGMWGNLLFYGRLIGISFPLFIIFLIGGLLFVSFPLGQRLRLRNLWPLVPAVFFAIMVAVRADQSILAIDIVMALSLGTLALYYLPLQHALDKSSLSEHLNGISTASVGILPAPTQEVQNAYSWMREKMPSNRLPMMSIGRGLLFALPIVIVFGALLGAADEIFSDQINQIWQSLNLRNATETVQRTLMTLTIGWLAAGALAYGLARRERQLVPRPVSKTQSEAVVDDSEDVLTPATPKSKPGFKLSIIESGIILGSVNLMFGVFVLIQFTYFFGGRVAEGLTYAEYARRGFFELVTVSILTLGLGLILDWITVRQSARENRVFRFMAVVMIGLTAVMLVSAWQRMSLYESEFGFTHLRIYTRVFMVWLVVLFGFFIAAVFRLRENVFALGIVLVIVGFTATLNGINVDGYIAERNIERYRAGYPLDVRFLSLLSADAVPAIIILYEETDDSALRADLGQILVRHWMTLQRLRDYGGGDTLLSGNMGRDHAWQMLTDMQGMLPEYDAAYNLWNYRSYDYSR